MSFEQRITDWETPYENQPEWEDPVPCEHLMWVLHNFELQGPILEVGCGTGVNTQYLASQGFQVLGLDISQRAISRAQQNNVYPNADFKVDNIMNLSLDSRYGTLYEKGCLHSFQHPDAFRHFAKQVSTHLKEDGLWVHVSGNANTQENLQERSRLGYPRLSLSTLTNAVEPHFKVKLIKEVRYSQKHDFLGWLGVFQKRQTQDLNLVENWLEE